MADNQKQLTVRTARGAKIVGRDTIGPKPTELQTRSERDSRSQWQDRGMFSTEPHRVHALYWKKACQVLSRTSE